jgi:hypothetical protein
MDFNSMSSFAPKFHPTNVAGGRKAFSILHGFARWHLADTHGESSFAVRWPYCRSNRYADFGTVRAAAIT